MDFLSDSGGLSWEIIVENRKKARSELLKNRTENSPNTVKAYGDVQNYTSGIPKEWKQYADAKAGDIVNGVTMTELKKKVYGFRDSGESRGLLPKLLHAAATIYNFWQGALARAPRALLKPLCLWTHIGTYFPLVFASFCFVVASFCRTRYAPKIWC